MQSAHLTRWRVFAGGALALALLACDTGPDPITPPAVYELVGTLDQPLPAGLASDTLCVTRLMGGRLEFADRDSYHSSYTIERACLGGRVERLADPGVTGSYNVTRDTVHFLDPGGLPTGFGVIHADSITVTGPLHTLVFRLQPRSPL